MRFSERSRICLIARRAKEQIQDFSFRRLPSKIASDFRRQTRVLFLSEKGRVFPELACFFPLPLRGRGNKILPFFPIPLESEERRSPQIPLESEGTRSRGKYRKRKKYRNRRNGRPLRFQGNLRGPGIGGDRKKKNRRSTITDLSNSPKKSEWTVVSSNSFRIGGKTSPENCPWALAMSRGPRGNFRKTEEQLILYA